MRGRGLLFFSAFTLVGTLVLLALGTWQWQRRAEKHAFIAQIAAAAQTSAKPLAEGAPWERVSVTGRYRPEKTAYIRTSRPAPKPGERDRFGRVPVSGFGVQVITAFNTEFCEAGIAGRRSFSSIAASCPPRLPAQSRRSRHPRAS